MTSKRTGNSKSNDECGGLSTSRCALPVEMTAFLGRSFPGSDNLVGMHVRVLLFGVLKDRLGGAEQAVELTQRARVADVTEWARGLLRDDGLVRSLAVAVNREYATPETELREGDEVALLPPVSGGVHGDVRFWSASRLMDGCR